MTIGKHLIQEPRNWASHTQRHMFQPSSAFILSMFKFTKILHQEHNNTARFSGQLWHTGVNSSCCNYVAAVVTFSVPLFPIPTQVGARVVAPVTLSWLCYYFVYMYLAYTSVFITAITGNIFPSRCFCHLLMKLLLMPVLKIHFKPSVKEKTGRNKRSKSYWL